MHGENECAQMEGDNRVEARDFSKSATVDLEHTCSAAGPTMADKVAAAEHYAARA